MEKLERKTEGLNVTYAPVVKEQKTSEEIINKVLYVIVAILFCAVLSTYFVEDLPDFVPEVRGIAIDAIWLILCCYTIGELVKRIFINKARSTVEYQKAKETTKTALEGLTEEELERRGEYCAAYEEEVYAAELKRLLKNANISEEDYEGKYRLLTVKEIKVLYPNNGLSKKQLSDLKEINRLKRVRYNPAFLMTTVSISSARSPSEMYDSERELRRNSFTSAITSIVSGFFGATFAGELIFSFSSAILFAAVVKITITLITAALKANFGWNCAMKTEINRFLLQQTEVKKLKHWCAINPKK